jgi:hypothetical protein
MLLWSEAFGLEQRDNKVRAKPKGDEKTGKRFEHGRLPQARVSACA